MPAGDLLCQTARYQVVRKSEKNATNKTLKERINVCVWKYFGNLIVYISNPDLLGKVCIFNEEPTSY